MGSATVLGAVLLSALALLFLGGWHEERQRLVDAESDRELGRVWGMTCAAAHRAVQAGLVTAPGAVPPGPVTAPATLAVAQLRNPPAPFEPFLPAGLRVADVAGALEARYGAVLVDGVPLAVCGLSGPEAAVRGPELLEGARMAGLDTIGLVDGDATPMHARIAAVEAVLGALGAGSLFVTADFGLGHAAERVHRRAVGGRPELSRVEQDLEFDADAGIVGGGRVMSERAEAVSGTMPETARAEAAGDAVVGAAGSLAVRAATEMEAGGGFAFGGGTQTAWQIPGAFAIGTSMRSRGRVQAGSVEAAGDLEAGGGLEARSRMTAGRLALSGLASAVTAGISGTLVVDSCTGCEAPPPLGSAR